MMPVTQSGVLTVGTIGPPSRFSAPGLDFGYFSYSVSAGKTVAFANPNVKF